MDKNNIKPRPWQEDWWRKPIEDPCPHCDKNGMVSYQDSRGRWHTTQCPCGKRSTS